jgi:hypothetical protein
MRSAVSPKFDSQGGILIGRCISGYPPHPEFPREVDIISLVLHIADA